MILYIEEEHEQTYFQMDIRENAVQVVADNLYGIELRQVPSAHEQWKTESLGEMY